MKDFIIPVNNEAHSRALKALFGPEKAQEFLKAYTTIDEAMVFGYERGRKDALAELPVGDGVMEYKAAFDDGHHAGYIAAEEAYRSQEAQDAQVNIEHSYDDGYIDGVSDARVSPAEADARVAELCNADDYAHGFDYFGFDDAEEAETFENYDIFADAYQGDSGDETDAVEAYWAQSHG